MSWDLYNFATKWTSYESLMVLVHNPQLNCAFFILSQRTLKIIGFCLAPPFADFSFGALKKIINIYFFPGQNC